MHTNSDLYIVKERSFILELDPPVLTFQTALQRLFNYCESRVMEVTVAGKMVSDMVRAAVKVSIFTEMLLNIFISNWMGKEILRVL